MKMKKIVVIALFGASSLFAGQNYRVTVTNENDQVNIRFVTTKTFSSMCGLTNTRLLLSTGKGYRAAAENGLIDVTAVVLPETACLTAFGPHTGGLSLGIGHNLPALMVGEYKLVINGEDQGTLSVSRDGATLN